METKEFEIEFKGEKKKVVLNQLPYKRVIELGDNIGKMQEKFKDLKFKEADSLLRNVFSEVYVSGDLEMEKIYEENRFNEVLNLVTTMLGKSFLDENQKKN